MRGATTAAQCSQRRRHDFNPRSSCEERRSTDKPSSGHGNFNPRSSCEERRSAASHKAAHMSYFNPRSSCEERQGSFPYPVPCPSDFNPRSSCEERPARRPSQRPLRDFNPRSSCEERRYEHMLPTVVTTFQSTLLMRGATFGVISNTSRAGLISIHAPHARSDTSVYEPHFYSNQISIHAPHARSDMPVVAYVPQPTKFQSTLLMRGATAAISMDLSSSRNFNPRSSCEERRVRAVPPASSRRDFNPRSSCEERLCLFVTVIPPDDFNPRSSCEERRETRHPIHLLDKHFNPRSSCEERPIRMARNSTRSSYFNPRSSCEERLKPSASAPFTIIFQSTLLMRGATFASGVLRSRHSIFQSTLLMRGATRIAPRPRR